MMRDRSKQGRLPSLAARNDTFLHSACLGTASEPLGGRARARSRARVPYLSRLVWKVFPLPRLNFIISSLRIRTMNEWPTCNALSPSSGYLLGLKVEMSLNVPIYTP